jgi:hypothetical protein|tara:strand:+ start:645 stop:761 length:117 start_codon:yes stop_codon:yes gene_type:complete
MVVVVVVRSIKEVFTGSEYGVCFCFASKKNKNEEREEG